MLCVCLCPPPTPPGIVCPNHRIKVIVQLELLTLSQLRGPAGLQMPEWYHRVRCMRFLGLLGQTATHWGAQKAQSLPTQHCESSPGV